jgi:hypothetical protein
MKAGSIFTIKCRSAFSVMMLKLIKEDLKCHLYAIRLLGNIYVDVSGRVVLGLKRGVGS